MKTLVTGGAGFIGSTLVDRLLADGHEVAVVDDLSSGSEVNLAGAFAEHGDRVRLHRADIRDAEAAAIVEAAGPEVLFHLAAQADVRVSVDDPVLDASINIMGSLNVIEAFRRSGGRKVVFASSGGTIYGDPDPADLPVDESHPQHPVSPYGVSKKVVGDYLAAFAELHGLDYTALALANVYGPRQDPHGEAGVVAIFAGRLLADETCTIYGTGEQTRDFVFVDDVVDAFARAAERGRRVLCNIGTGTETSVNQLYASMAAAVGSELEPARAPARVGELERSVLDPSLAGRELGWAPAHDITSGVEATMAWFRTR